MKVKATFRRQAIWNHDRAARSVQHIPNIFLLHPPVATASLPPSTRREGNRLHRPRNDPAQPAPIRGRRPLRLRTWRTTGTHAHDDSCHRTSRASIRHPPHPPNARTHALRRGGGRARKNRPQRIRHRPSQNSRPGVCARCGLLAVRGSGGAARARLCAR